MYIKYVKMYDNIVPYNNFFQTLSSKGTGGVLIKFFTNSKTKFNKQTKENINKKPKIIVIFNLLYFLCYVLKSLF